MIALAFEDKEMLLYLWQKCAYIWNDVHLIVLMNYIFEAAWPDGLRIILTSAQAKEIFNSMNLFEKSKFVSFCEISAYG